MQRWKVRLRTRSEIADALVVSLLCHLHTIHRSNVCTSPYSIVIHAIPCALFTQVVGAVLVSLDGSRFLSLRTKEFSENWILSAVCRVAGRKPVLHLQPRHGSTASTATEPSRTEHGPCTRTTLHGRTDAVEPRDGLRSAVRAKPKVRCLFFPEKWIPTGLLSSKPQTNVQSVKRTKCASLAGSGCGPVPGNKPMEMESPGREYRHRYGTVSGSE